MPRLCRVYQNHIAFLCGSADFDADGKLERFMSDAVAIIYGLFLFGLLFTYIPACEKV